MDLREKCLQAKKMKENEKRLKVFFFLILFYGKGQAEFGYIVSGLNGAQWVFS